MVKLTVEEKRRYIRAKRILSIEFRLARSKGKNRDNAWHLSTTHDMSLGGLSFYTDVEFQVEDFLELRVVMSGILDIFKGYGQVVRVERKRTGAHYLVAIKFIGKELFSKKRPLKSSSSLSRRKLIGKKRI